MSDGLKELKSVLRSLVVSSPTQVDVRTLLRDYRSMVGAHIPLAKYGYKDPLAFLKEQCSDCFIFTGLPSNPVLTLIVPDNLKHIDKFVQKQKVSSVVKSKGKRRSIPGSILNPQPSPEPHHDLIFNTFAIKSQLPTITEPKKVEAKLLDIEKQDKENLQNGNVDPKDNTSSNAVMNFLKKRMPLYSSSQHLDGNPTSLSDKECTSPKDDDSGKQTSSSGSSAKQLQLEELKAEVMEIISDAPNGVWCTDLIRLYRERFGRELNFTRLGYTSIISLVFALEADMAVARPQHTGDWLLGSRAAPPARRAAPRRPRAAPPPPLDPDDALPGVDFDPDVFPEDCMHFLESIPAASLDDFAPGAMVEVMVGEVYSPSHFWLIRLGDRYNIAMEDMMDEMTHYYTTGEGKDRRLARGAVRVGHYCSSVYENDWHRSLIVKIIDCDTVKVRHVDYGTVDRVASAALKPLRREWAALARQALRARLAGARPAAAGRRWPHSAAAHFLQRVRDKRLVANVVARDPEDDIVEVLLIDTAGAADVCVSTELVRAGHADARADAALRVSGRGDARSDDSASASQLAGRAPRRLPTWDNDPVARPERPERSERPSRLQRVAALHASLCASGPSSSGSSTLCSPPRLPVAAPVKPISSVLRRRLDLDKKLREGAQN